MLIIPLGSSRFFIYSDASYKRLGCILMMNGKVITYVLQQLKEYENNYPTYDLELAIVVLTFKIWTLVT